jgi:cytoskeleton protein RodZ
VSETIETAETAVEEDVVEVRRDGPLAVVVGLAAAGVAIAYLARAVGSDGWLDWALMGLLGAIAALHLTSFLDARTPLLLADQQGIRMRSGRTWRGVAWPEVVRVEHLPRRGLLRDGRIAVVTRHDEELGLRLSMATRLVGADWDELTEALRELAGEAGDVVELRPVDDRDEPAGPEPEHETETEPAPEPPMTTADPADRAPSPLRRLVGGVRVEMGHLIEGTTARARRPVDLEATMPLPEVELLRRDDEVLIDEVGPEPAADPVIGPQLAAARTRLGLTVDQLADRTRIRPHVIESIEVDDFAPCGGDFYARGHLRTLARVVGTDAAPLLRSYDQHYADAPIDPRRVFQAELATGAGGPIRGTRGGVNWSVLVAAVMAAILVWSIARLIMDGPVDLDRAPVLNGSPSHGGQGAGAAPEVPVVFTAAGGGAKLKVRDGQGDLVFDGDLAFGQSTSLEVSPPVRVWTSDGSVTATIDGEQLGALGETGDEASGTYAAAP